MAKRAPARRRPRKAKPGTKGLDRAQCRLEQSEGSAAEAAEAVEKAGGCVVGQYKEPLGGHPTLLSILPIGKIDPTPFQRDLSDTHHKRLADVINKTGYFLDPRSSTIVARFSCCLSAERNDSSLKSSVYELLAVSREMSIAASKSGTPAARNTGALTRLRDCS
jgi:hypothetical protein